MRKQIKKAFKLLKEKEYQIFIYKLLDRVPYSIFRYNNFYIMHCREISNKRLFRPLGNEYKLIIKEFSYELLDRIRKELPQDLETVYYRAKGREWQTKAIYIEKSGKIVSTCFVLFDSKIPSPSSYVLDMGGRVVVSCYGIFVGPKFRMKGLHFHMLNAAFDLSSEVGTPGLYGEIHYMNKNSLVSHLKIGFEVYKNIKYIKLFGKIFFYEDVPELWFMKRNMKSRNN